MIPFIDMLKFWFHRYWKNCYRNKDENHINFSSVGFFFPNLKGVLIEVFNHIMALDHCFLNQVTLHHASFWLNMLSYKTLQGFQKYINKKHHYKKTWLFKGSNPTMQQTEHSVKKARGPSKWSRLSQIKYIQWPLWFTFNQIDHFDLTHTWINHTNLAT